MTDDIKKCHECGSDNIQIVSVDEPKVHRIAVFYRCKDCNASLVTDYTYTDKELDEVTVDLKACVKDSLHKGLVERWHELCHGKPKEEESVH